MPQVSVKSIEVYYRDEGVGTPVVLGHSSTGTGGQWRALFERLGNRYRLIAPDHLGYGRTGSDPGGLPIMERETAIIGELLDLAAEPAHLVGHSYGGSVMARVAVLAPHRVRSLTLIEPTLFHLLAAAGRAEEHKEIRAVADRVIQYVDAGEPREAARGFIDYWLGIGTYDAMDDRVRGLVPPIAIPDPLRRRSEVSG